MFAEQAVGGLFRMDLDSLGPRAKAADFEYQLVPDRGGEFGRGVNWQDEGAGTPVTQSA